MDLAEAKDFALYLMAHGRTKPEAIIRVAFEMSASMQEYEEIKATLGAMELDPDKDLDEVISKLEEGTK